MTFFLDYNVKLLINLVLKAARSAELMNQSLSSSTMSMDRIHEEKFDVEDRLQKVREELEDIKRQNEEYQKNLSNMAKVSALIP